MKIGIIQLAKMGDLIQSNHLIKKLKQNNNDVEITLLHSDIFNEVIPFLDCDKNIGTNLDKISSKKEDGFILNKNKTTQNLIEIMNKNSFDLLINLNSNELAESLVTTVNSKRKIGFGSTDTRSKYWLSFVWSFIKSRKLSTINLVDVFLNLIEGVYEFENKGSNQKSGVVTFQLGSRNIKRQIPIESFVELAKLFIEDNKKIQLVGVNSEAHFGNEFLKHFTDKSMIDNLIGKTTIAELYEVIDNSEQLITTDTGTLHIAATLQTPTLSFFVGPAYSPETAGYNPNQKIHSPTLTDFPCYPCKDDVACPYNYSCQKKIDMNKIYKAVFDKDKLENLSQPFYDELGQIILPIYEGNQITKELYFSFIYRIFAIKYFKNIDKNVSFYIQNYSINNDELIRWNSELKRELKLFNYLNFNMNTLKTAEKNFKILTPLLYLFFILKRKDAIVIQLYEFLEEIVT